MVFAVKTVLSDVNILIESPLQVIRQYVSQKGVRSCVLHKALGKTSPLSSSFPFYCYYVLAVCSTGCSILISVCVTFKIHVALIGMNGRDSAWYFNELPFLPFHIL